MPKQWVESAQRCAVDRQGIQSGEAAALGGELELAISSQAGLSETGPATGNRGFGPPTKEGSRDYLYTRI